MTCGIYHGCEGHALYGVLYSGRRGMRAPFAGSLEGVCDVGSCTLCARGLRRTCGMRSRWYVL